MTLTTLIDRTRRTTDSPAEAHGDAEVADLAPVADAPAGPDPDADARTDTPAARAVGREADGLAVASFVLGLVGLLVFNIVLGPMAIVMALLALVRRTRRRGRARLGLALGVADLAVLGVLVTVNGTVGWSIGG
ncbi:hypothetical protein ACFWRV_11040 [Streptomyces sp. NPDC058576]|uniref:hypothetical protein n=1 Tax=Streptomyces sp. NPDC058576 TaxID=3346547 RepID=UPI00365C053F